MAMKIQHFKMMFLLTSNDLLLSARCTKALMDLILQVAEFPWNRAGSCAHPFAKACPSIFRKMPKKNMHWSSRYLTISSPHPRHQHRADWCHQRYHLAPCTPKPHTSWSGRTTAERAMPSFLLKGIEFSLIEMLVKLPKIRNSSTCSIQSAFGTVYSAGNEGISFVSLQFNWGMLWDWMGTW